MRISQTIKVLILYLVFWTLLNQAASQNSSDFSFDLITSENKILQKGLSANTVYAVLQDSYGYMWFGTWDGLNKFDGYAFTTYNRRNGLSNETIHALHETEDGNIWIGTDDGLNCFDRTTEKFEIFRYNPNDSTSLSNNKINYLYQDKPGRLIVCTDKGLNIIDLKSKIISRYLNVESGSRKTRSNNINCVLVGSDNMYWVGTNFGLVEYNTESYENIRHLHRPKDTNSLSSNRVRIIYEDHRKRLWVGTEDGLSLYDREKKTFRVFVHDEFDETSLSSNFVECLYEDKQGRFWVGTNGGGLNLVNPETLKFERISVEKGKPGSLSNNRIYSICEDVNQNLWFGTFNGVNVIDRFKPSFELYTYEMNNPESLNDNFVWAFLEYRPHIIWVGTDKGISVFNTHTRKFSPLSSYFLHKNKLSSNRIRSMLLDAQNNVWIGTRDAGLNKLETQTGKVHIFQPSIQRRNSICDNSILTLYQDSQGVIWVGTLDGLNTIDPVSHEIQVFKNDPDVRGSISNNAVYDVMEDHEGELWFATLAGLNRFDRISKTFTTYKDTARISDVVSAGRLFCLFEDSNNDIWIGTRGDGLQLFNRENQTFKTYTTDDGLPNNVVYGIEEDKMGNLWMSTNWGISMFDIKNESFINFDVTEGLQSNEFNANAHLISSTGEMFFGGMKGFNTIFPEDIIMNQSKPDIVITSFKKFNIIQPGQLLNHDTIMLSYNENFFSFEFSALDYTNAFRSKYAYKLDGYYRNWTYVDGRRHFAEYANVAPGSYTFRVIGANNNGIWNMDGVSLTIIIKPPWYQTWFFRITALLLFASFVWLVIYSRVRRARRKHTMEKRVLKIEKQLIEIQQKALRLQMNPHFIFNSLNSIQSFILTRDIDLAVNYLSKFSQLMRLILNNSGESIIPLADEIQAVVHYLEIEKLRFDYKFDYTINIAPEIDEEFVGVPPMILQPYVENSIIHGLVHKPTKGHIEINFSFDGSNLVVTISDDGIGREMAMKLKNENGLQAVSRGMLITKERLDILNRNTNHKLSVNVTDLKSDNGKPCGTRVVLNILYQEL